MIQLKVRTEFSFRETFAPLHKVIERLQAVGASAAGMVDLNGSTWGHVRWESELAKAGIQPMFGAEIGVADKATEDARAPTAWFLATDAQAMYHLTSLAHRQAQSGQPFLTTDQFLGAEGVIRFTGSALCDRAEAVEAGCHIDLNPGSVLSTQRALGLHRRTKGHLVLTGDNYFPSPADRKLFELSGRASKTTPQHIMTESELKGQFNPLLNKTQIEEALLNAAHIAEVTKGVKLRKAPLIKLEGDVEALCRAGMKRRLKDKQIAKWTPEYEQRLVRELKLVKEKNFDSYFLMVADMVLWAKERMLVGPARGSSAGSLACYLMGITEVDPLPYGLMFERFVDVTRKDLPDIDIDFPDTTRDSVYEYLRGKYGEPQVARIGTISEYKPKSALAEVAKRLRIPPWETQAVKDAMFVRSSGDSRINNCLMDTLNETEPGKLLVEKFPAIALAGEIEGHASHTGLHAAGVIVCNEPVSNFCTVADGVAQLDKIDAEALNLLKIDVLGLRTLSVIEDSGIATNKEIYKLKFTDPAVFKLINSGKFSGIFQWEGQALQSLTSQITLKDFDDMAHITALARPGPLGGGAAGKFSERHSGKAKIDVAHPSMLPYLAETYGLVLYQEQVMRIVREIGQFDWDETSTIRKAMSGRKGKEFFDKMGAKFVVGAATVGLKEREAKDIWEQINSMGAWAFNKCAAGSTLVKIAHAGGSLKGWMRLDELHERYVANPSTWIKQRGSMPMLYSVHPDGRAYPHQVKTIHKNGAKRCKRYKFNDGTEVVCTEDHKFVINDAWRCAGESHEGDDWLMADLQRQEWLKRGSAAAGKHWRTEDGGRRVSPSEQNRRTAIRDEFCTINLRAGCTDCGQRRKRMEAHHNDFNEGLDRPHDLAWLCAGCHKRRHYAAGRTKINEKGLRLGWKRLISIQDAGEVETYDIEMEEHHNYVINGGIVTHNSHSVSYAMVSYWTAWMKAHHPLAYIASALRNAKDDETAFNMLREIADEGIEYIPFDPDLSELNWSVKDGRLVGGFLGLHGIGMATATAMLKSRAEGGLTDKQREKLSKAKLIFGDLYPAHTMWSDYYERPEAVGLKKGSVVLNIADFPADGEVVFIGQLKQKDSRDYNEAVRLAKRGGKLMKAPTLFLDMRVMDDTSLSPLLCRIDRYDYDPIGRLLLERGREDHDWFLIRGQKLKNFPMVQVEKIKCLSNPELFKE